MKRPQPLETQTQRKNWDSNEKEAPYPEPSGSLSAENMPKVFAQKARILFKL